MSADLGLLSARGVRVRQVSNLNEQALFLPKCELLLLDVNLTDQQITAAIDGVLPRVWDTGS